MSDVRVLGISGGGEGLRIWGCPSVGRIGSIPKAESELKGWVKSWRLEVLGCSPGNGWGRAGAASVCRG